MKKIYYILLMMIILIFSSCMNSDFDFNSLLQTKVKVTVVNNIYYDTGEETNMNISIYKDNEKIQDIKNLKSGKYEEVELNSGTYKFIASYDDQTYEKNYEINSEVTIKVSEIVNQ